jgi:hypothetical protein
LEPLDYDVEKPLQLGLVAYGAGSSAEHQKRVAGNTVDNDIGLYWGNRRSGADPILGLES